MWILSLFFLNFDFSHFFFFRQRTDGRMDKAKVFPVRKTGIRYQFLGENNFITMFSMRNSPVMNG